MSNERLYGRDVKIGNWFEDRILDEDAQKEYLRKKERGELAAQKVDFLKHNIMRPEKLSVTNDGMLHFGDVVMLVNVGGESEECSAVSINADMNGFTRTPAPGLRSPCGVSAGPDLHPRTRTAFIITSVDGSPDGSTLHYEQSFALRTTDGFARRLYLTSDVRSFQKCAKKSRLQEVNLVEEASFLSWWKIVYFDPQERLEYECYPVPANEAVVIIHCKTNQALAVMNEHVLWTTYGKEYEVTAHTFLDSHKAELDKNHWLVCTSDPSGAGLLLFNQPASAAQSGELEQTNQDPIEH